MGRVWEGDHGEARYESYPSYASGKEGLALVASGNECEWEGEMVEEEKAWGLTGRTYCTAGALCNPPLNCGGSKV